MTNNDIGTMLEKINTEIIDTIHDDLQVLHEDLWDNVIKRYIDFISEEVMENIADIITETIGQDGRLNNMVKQMMSASTVSNIDSALSSINLRTKSIEKINGEYVIKAE